MSKLKTKDYIKPNITGTLHIYTRVSTTSQEEEGTSLETQLEQGIERSTKLGFTHRHWDEGEKSITRDDLSISPVLSNLLNEIDEGNVRHLFVWNTDCLSRNINTWNIIRLKLIQNEVTLHTPTGEQVLSDPTTNLMLGIMSEMSDYEKEKRVNYIQFRSKLGLNTENYTKPNIIQLSDGFHVVEGYEDWPIYPVPSSMETNYVRLSDGTHVEGYVDERSMEDTENIKEMYLLRFPVEDFIENYELWNNTPHDYPLTLDSTYSPNCVIYFWYRYIVEVIEVMKDYEQKVLGFLSRSETNNVIKNDSIGDINSKQVSTVI